MSGSPPHVRGKDCDIPLPPLSVRITPACAGKSTTRHRTAAFYRDHPRMCGEKPLIYKHGTYGEGSPPHVRGKVRIGGTDYARGRITPACAGKSLFQPEPPQGRRDHPRMCGEKMSEDVTTAEDAGSPPHVRGKVRHRAVIYHDGRITPACAGKSRNSHVISDCSKDHPRMCGEKQ